MNGEKFTRDHEWIRVDGDVGVVGISDHAQEQLGDIVYIELPEVGKQVKRGDEVAVVESVKAASELYAPVSGEVVEVNQGLAEEPGLVNESPMDDGWFFKLKIAAAAELDELMDGEAYEKFLETVS